MIIQTASATTYLLLYVDDIIRTAFTTPLLQQIISHLSHEFSMTNLGPLNYFLGIFTIRSDMCLFLFQRKYAIDILERAKILNCNPCHTPAEPLQKLHSSGPTVADPTLYHSLASALQYLTFTRPKITFAVQHICLHIHGPRKQHLHALKRILRYTRGTIDHGLQIHISPTANLVAYSDTN